MEPWQCLLCFLNYQRFFLTIEKVKHVSPVQISSPACTELEVVMMDWLGKMLQLPEAFLSGGKGGGVIQVGLLWDDYFHKYLFQFSML